MTKRSSILVVLLVLSILTGLVSAWAAAGDLLWVDRVDRSAGTGFDGGHAAAADGTRFFAAGQSTGVAGDTDLIVRAYDQETGTLVWQDVYDPAGGFDFAYELAAGAGRVFAGGSSVTAAGRTFLVRAYDARTGALLWQDEVLGSGAANSVATDGARVFAGGRLSRAPGDSDFLLRAYEARTGTVLWQDQIDEGPAGRVGQLAVRGGRVYAAGFVGSCNEFFDNGGDCDFLVRAYAARTGTLLWSDRHDLGTYGIGRAVTVAGRLVVAVGYGGEFENSDFIVRAYDAETGTLAWQDRVDKAGKIDKAFSVTGGGGRVFAAGTGGDCRLFVEPGGDCDGLVRAYDAESGALLWEDRVDKGRDDLLGANVGVLSGGIALQGGRLYVTGGGGDCRWDAASNCDVLVRVNRVQDGQLIWEDQFDNAGGDDGAVDLAVHSGVLFAVGEAERAAGPPFGPDDWDLLVLAYDAR
jgi:glucose dehydrogenase